jgi:hypothetical protein
MPAERGIAQYRVIQTPEFALEFLARMSGPDAVDGSSNRHVGAMDVGAAKAPTIRRSQTCKRLRQSVSTLRSRSYRFTASMRKASGRPPSAEASVRSVFFEKLQPCLVRIEACASSHHWSRELRALGHANAARTDRPPRLAWARRAAFVGKRTTPEIHSCRMNACCRVRVTCTGRRANPERGRFFLELRERTHELRKQVCQTDVPKSD